LFLALLVLTAMSKNAETFIFGRLTLPGHNEREFTYEDLENAGFIDEGQFGRVRENAFTVQYFT
jgi:hypothetical protein